MCVQEQKIPKCPINVGLREGQPVLAQRVQEHRARAGDRDTVGEMGVQCVLCGVH